MHSKTSLLFAALVCASAHGPHAQAQTADQRLSTDELKQWYVGRSVEGHTEKGDTFRAYHAPDGKISGVAAGQYKNRGTYQIVEPGHVCIVWQEPGWGNKPCSYVIRDGDFWKIVRIDDEKSFARVKAVDGNAFGL